MSRQLGANGGRGSSPQIVLKVSGTTGVDRKWVTAENSIILILMHDDDCGEDSLDVT